jgi:hypothetical protein
VLRTIHDDLDAAVFEAYGWPRDLTDEEILERLVALNQERLDEERRGMVRWLRPEYQAKGAATEQAAMLEGDGGAAPSEAARPAKAASPPWPKPLAERVTAVRALLTGATRAWSLDEVRKTFARARAADVAEVLDALVGLGLLVAYDTPAGRRWRPAK